MTQNVVIPNSFQTPNIYVDRLLELLLDDEVRVLQFATRHILGWQDRIAERRGRISLTMFERGFTTATGTHYAGCGLSRPAIVAALEGLTGYGVMLAVGVANRHGQAWALLETEPDWEGLESRRADMKIKHIKKTEKATTAAKQKRVRRSGTTDVPVDHAGTTHVPLTGTTDVPNQTHVQTHVEDSASDDAGTGLIDHQQDATPPKKSVVHTTDPNVPEKPSIAPPAPPREKSPADLLFEAVAAHIFDIHDTAGMNESGGRIGMIAAWLGGKKDRFTGRGAAGNVGYIRSPALPKHVERFAGYWKASQNGATPPRDPVKFVEAWRAWASQAVKRQRVAQAVSHQTGDEPHEELTPEQITARKADLERLRQELRST